MLVCLECSFAVKFRTLLETLTPLLVEGSIKFDEAGMTISAQNRIAACIATIKKKAELLDYSFNSKKPIEVDISFDSLHQSLSSVSPSDSIRFSMTEESMNASRPFLLLHVFNRSSGYEFESRIYLLLLENEKVSLPKKKFQKVVSFSSHLFLKTLRFMSKRGTEVQVCTRTKIENKGTEEEKKIQYLIFRTCGDDGVLLFKQKFSGEDTTECLKKDLYSLRFLLLITKATNLSSNVEVFLNEKDILILKYRLSTIGSAVFALSPLIEEADDVPELTLATKRKKTKEVPVVSKYKRPIKRKRKNKSVSKMLVEAKENEDKKNETK